MVTIPNCQRLSGKPIRFTFSSPVTSKRSIGLLLGTVLTLGSSINFAAEPCPWKETAYSATCSRWETLMQRLDAAMAEAEAAAERLATLEPAPSPDTETTAMPAAERRVRAIIDRFLANLLPPTSDVGGFKIDRDYTLIQQDDTFSAYFPTVAWIAESNQVDFGPLTLEIKPQAGGLSQMDFHFGNLITIQENNQPIARILLNEQKNEAIWDDRLQNFARAQSQFADVNVVASDEPFLMDIERIDLAQLLSRDNNDTWHQQQTFRLTGLNIQLEDATVEMEQSLGRISLDGRDYQKFATLNSTLTNLAQRDMDDLEATAKVMDFISELYALFNHLEFNTIFTGIVVSAAEKPMTQIGRLTVGSQFQAGKDDQGSTLNYKIDLAGLQAPQTDIPADLLPTDARLEIGWYNIPANLFSQILETGLTSETLPPEEREAYINQQLTELALTSHLGMYIKDTFFAAPATRLELSFDAHFEPQAALGGVGELSLRIEGLQKLMDYATTLDEEQSAASFLALLVALSERTEQDGKTIDSFRVKLTPEGQLWLNDKDVTNLFIQSEIQETLPEIPENPE